jgi:pentatricopeptide repeat protein
MLQKFISPQKRHLEYSLPKFQRNLALGLRYHARHASAQLLQRPSIQKHAGIQPGPSPRHSVDSLTSWAAGATPFPELAPIINAFASNDTFDSIIQCVKSSPPLLSFFQDRNKMRDVAVNLAQSSKPHRSIDILELAHKVGHTLKPGAYEAVAFHLSSSKKNWELVLIAASLGIKHLAKPTARLLNWRARALLELQQYGLLQDILGDFDNAKLSPTDRTYQIVLAGCLQNHDMEGAKRCIRRMQQTGSPQTPRTLSLIGQFHRHFGVDRKVRQDTLDTLPNLSPRLAVVVLNTVIQSALDVKDVATALDLLTLFEQSYVEDIISVLEASHEPMTQILPKVHLPKIHGGFKPDTRTFAIVMNYHIRLFNFQRAVDLGEAALTKGYPATEDIVTSFVHAFFLQNRGNPAVEMIRRISSKPLPVEFGMLMARKERKVDQGTIPEISNVPLTTRICNAMLRGLLRRQGLRHVPTIFAIMHANDLRPNARTLEILVSHMSSSEGVRPSTILKVLQDLSASSSHFEVSIRHLHHLFRYILREEKRSSFGTGWRSYARRSGRINRKGRLPRSLGSSNPFDPLGGISFGSHTRYSRAAEPLLQSLAERKVKSDAAMISMRIRRDALLHGEIESAQDVFRTLSARGIHATHHHFSALMEGYSMMGDLDTAKEILELARNAGVVPNIVMYTTLIHGYGRKHDPSSAMQVFTEMVEQGIYPDVASIDAVVGAFFASGASRMARTHLIMLWPYIEPFPETLRHASLVTLIARFRSLDSSRSKTERTKKTKASIYHQLRRLLAAYDRYFNVGQQQPTLQ